MTGKRITSVVLMLIATAIIVWVGMAAWGIFFHETLKNVVLVRDFQITSEWKEVGTQSDLKVQKKYHNILLEIGPPLKAATSEWGIVVPGGEIVIPEIQLVDVEGKEYPLTIKGYRAAGLSEFIEFGYESGIPTDKIYQKVKLRSDHPVAVKAVLWSGYDQSDMK